jgi:hypothetical protein
MSLNINRRVPYGKSDIPGGWYDAIYDPFDQFASVSPG